MNHLAFVRADVAAKILKGVKRVESRLSKNRPPAWRVQVGDFIYFKIVGGDCVCRARVVGVDKYEQLRPADIASLAELYSPSMGTSPDNPYWNIKTQSRYAVLIHLAAVEPFHIPRERLPRAVMAAWVCDFQVGQAATNPQLALPLDSAR